MFFVSCDKEPNALMGQISFKYKRYVNYIKVKNFQTVDTAKPIAIYNIYSLNNKATVQKEFIMCLQMVQERIDCKNSFKETEQDLPFF